MSIHLSSALHRSFIHPKTLNSGVFSNSISDLSYGTASKLELTQHTLAQPKLSLLKIQAPNTPTQSNTLFAICAAQNTSRSTTEASTTTNKTRLSATATQTLPNLKAGSRYRFESYLLSICSHRLRPSREQLSLDS